MHKFKIRALGEIAIRCKDYDAMRTFYGEVLKLTPLNESIGGKMPAANIQFYQLGESYGGHTSILALFTDEHKHQTNSGTSSSLHHIALTVAYKAQDAAKSYLESQGYACHFEKFAWAGWRGLFTEDPDGNTVELVVARPLRLIR